MSFAFRLNNSSGVPYYRQIVNQVTYGVVNRIMKPGERLPTVRQLAVDLQVNLNTIVKAYSELELRGYVNTQQGTGTFISDTLPRGSAPEQEQGLSRLCATFLDEVAAMEIKTEDAFSTLKAMQKERIQKGLV